MLALLAAVLASFLLQPERAEPARRSWSIDGTTREALVFVPATPEHAPIVFAFHGHGGNALQAARSFRIHREWPDAIVVYMQGLPTPGMTDPEGKKNGWQRTTGDQGDRDLRFFDAVLASIQTDYKPDDRRVYAMGHSNGGAFTYLLWAARGDTFAAVAPSSAPAGLRLNLTPKPAMHVAGTKDQIVPFRWQSPTIERIKKLNGCDEKGRPYGDDCTIYPSNAGTPLVTMIHDGGHAFLADAPAMMVKFFKEHQKPARDNAKP